MNTFLIKQLRVVSSGIRVKTINNNIYKKKMLKNITILEYYVGDTEIIFGYNLKAPLNV